MKFIIGKRFFVEAGLSNDGLWQTDVIGGVRHYEILSAAIVDRPTNYGRYKGFQLIVWKLLVCVGDRNSFTPKEKLNEH